jgi:L-methionine (R)-S-oxide reductase
METRTQGGRAVALNEPDLLMAPELTSREAQYADVRARIDALLEGETDFVAAMATVVCELHHTFSYYHWTGFYRHVEPEMLVIGPYQGGHGCLRIPFSRGVCGAAARLRETQLVPDVELFPGHIACSSSTKSEIVVPVLTPDGRVLAVLDVDSDDPDAFNETDQVHLEALCMHLGERFAGG